MSIQIALYSASLVFSGIFALLSGACALSFRRARAPSLLVRLGLLCLSLGVSAAALAAALASPAFAPSAADLRAFATCAAAALSLDLSQELHTRPRSRVVRAGYGLMLLSMLAVLFSPTTQAAALHGHVGLWGSWAPWTDAPVTLARQWVAGALVVVLVAATVSLLDAAFLQRRRVAAMGVGLLGWTCAVSFDLTAWRLSIPLPRLSELAALGYAVAAFAAVWSAELDLRDAAVAARDRELAALGDTLADVRATLAQREPLALVGELSAIIAHEVRNPIAIMVNAASSLRREGLHPTDRALLLTIVEEESDRLNRIVTDLLALARPMAPQRRLVDMHEMLERSLAIARKAEIDVTLRVTDGAGDALRCDAVLFRQAVENVVANAVQAMGHGGQLAVAIARRERAGVQLREITVTDSGEGMNTEVRNNARKPFFTTRSNGTGLGLAIVERIVSAHGGTLEIESARGAGTTVRILVPEERDSGIPQI